MNAYQFWQRVDLIREERKMNLEQLSAAIGIKHQSIRDQRSKDLIPKSETLYKISQVLDISMEYLLVGRDTAHITTAQIVYDYMEANMPGTLDDILSKVQQKKLSSGKITG